jgi:ZIP family zinc transporter
MSGLLADGFALHNGTEGFGIVGSSSNHPSSLKDIILLGLLAGGPACLGTVNSGYGIEPYLSLSCYALVAGSLLYVIVSLVALSSTGNTGCRPRRTCSQESGLCTPPIWP